MAAARKLAFSVHPFFWLFAGLIGWLITWSLMGALNWVVVIFVSVVVHELGHAFTAIAFGQEAAIRLEAFGGVTYRRGAKLKLWQDFLITLNGPLAGLALAGIAFLLLHYVAAKESMLVVTLTIFVYVNLFWTAVNLLPVLPLDGGHLLRIVLERFWGHRATSIAFFVGMVLGAAIAVAGLLLGYFFLAMLFMILGFESFRGWRAYRMASEHDQKPEMQQLFGEAIRAAESGAPDVGIEKLRELRDATGKGLLYTAASQHLARLLSLAGEREEAFAILRSIKGQIAPEFLPLYQKLAYEEGQYQEVVQIASDTFQASRTYSVAFVNALAHAALEEIEPAIGWLQCAQREGMPSMEKAIEDPQFDPIRRDPAFSTFTSSLSS